MKNCAKCGMPNTRPATIMDEYGICQACLNYKKRETIDWNARMRELDELCGSLRRNDGNYDCVIPVSGGKDSHVLVYMMKEKLGMNPLLVTVGDYFTKTKAGEHNLRNLCDVFDCDHLLYKLSRKTFLDTARIGFEVLGEPLKYLESVIYTMPIKIAVGLKIPLIMYGEDAAYEYGSSTEESRKQPEDVVNWRLLDKIFDGAEPEFWVEEGMSLQSLGAVMPPSRNDILSSRIQCLFMSHYMPWSSTRNLQIAKSRGFMDLTHEWRREGYIEDFEQMDSMGYLIHLWMKYPKFGFQRASDIASRRVREGILKLSDAEKLVKENDHRIDQLALDDFCTVLGYSHKEFWEIAEKHRRKIE